MKEDRRANGLSPGCLRLATYCPSVTTTAVSNEILYGDGAMSPTVVEGRRQRQRELDERPTEIAADGTRYWRNAEGQLHRESGPAVIEADGTQRWYLNGKRHRDGGPAAELPNGLRKWYRHGKLHRTDGPAVEKADGTREWWVDGEFQRFEEVDQAGRRSLNRPC